MLIVRGLRASMRRSKRHQREKRTARNAQNPLPSESLQKVHSCALKTSNRSAYSNLCKNPIAVLCI